MKNFVQKTEFDSAYLKIIFGVDCDFLKFLPIFAKYYSFSKTFFWMKSL